jgi:acetolactate synthase-1/2/3 large subunit
MVRWKQAVDRFADWGLTFGNPDFVKYAESYGAQGSRVEAADGLVPALEVAFEAGGVHLVAVPVDYSENKRVLVDEIAVLSSAVVDLEEITNPALHLNFQSTEIIPPST